MQNEKLILDALALLVRRSSYHYPHEPQTSYKMIQDLTRASKELSKPEKTDG